MVDGVELDRRVVIDEVVELAGAQGKGGDYLAGVDGLARAVDDAGTEQGKQAIGEHLRVDAEVAMA